MVNENWQQPANIREVSTKRLRANRALFIIPSLVILIGLVGILSTLASVRSASGQVASLNPVSENEVVGSLVISATSNIFGAGKAVPPGGGTLPPFVSFPANSVQAVRFVSVTGQVIAGNNHICGFGGPDGNPGCRFGTNVNSWEGISGLIHLTRTLFLVGVFLDDSVPADPSPVRLDVTNDNGVLEFWPLLNQTFFIGDGRNTTGQLQEFHVPVGATRLFLGFVDGFDFMGNPGFYDDNGGEMYADYELLQVSAIQGIKYHDQNGNGVKDTGEPPFADWTIMLEDANGIVVTTTTDATGAYTFTNVLGNYRVAEEMPHDWAATQPPAGIYQVNIASGQTISDMDFGNWFYEDEYCQTGWDIQITPGENFVIVSGIIHNNSTETHSYDVDIMGSPGMPVTGSLMFNPPPPYTIEPGSEQYFSMRLEPVPNPATSAGIYQLIVSNLDAGYSFGCQGQIWRANQNFWLTVPGQPFVLMTFEEAVTIYFTIENLTNMPLNMGFEIEGMVEGGNNLRLNNSIVSLNGLPPGQNVTGTVTIQPGETMTFSVQAELTEDTTNFFGDIIFYADMDNDGVIDAATSVMVSPGQPTSNQIFLPFMVKP